MNNQAYLIAVAHALGPIVEEVVFTGGRVVQEYLAVPAVREPRVTEDADVIVEATTYAEYMAFGERLKARGFSQSANRNTPPYRWERKSLVLDVMPLDAEVLGFTNRWYRSGVATAEEIILAESTRIKILDAPHFLASKMEAYGGRGGDDPYLSHDLEDLVSVISGRPDCVAEVKAAGPELAGWLGSRLASVFPHDRRIELVAGHLSPTVPPGLADVVAERLSGLVNLAEAS